MKKSLGLLYALILVLGFYNVASAVEIAIKWCDTGHVSTTYEIGDIIMAAEDNNDWRGLDPSIEPCVAIVQITDMTLAEFQSSQYAQSLWNETDPLNPVLLKKRRFGYPKSNIPQNIKNYIENNDGFISTDKATVNSWLHDKTGDL